MAEHDGGDRAGSATVRSTSDATGARQEVAAAVRRTRVARGRSLRDLAAAIGVSPATLSAIETGKVTVTMDRLQLIADALDVTPARLVAGGLPAPAPAGVARCSGGGGDWRAYGPLELGPVLGAALRVFVDRGFHAATMREVAAEAGLSVAGVYHHHVSKHQMLVELLDVTMAEIRWRLLAARDEVRAAGEERTAVDAFARMVESLALFHALRGDLAFLGASEMRGLAADERERITALRGEVQHLLDEQADRAIAAGELSSSDPRTATRAIATMCTSLPSWFRPDGELGAEQVAQRYADYARALLR